MSSYSLLECKLRRYIYLGNEYSIYVPPSIRNTYCKKKHQHEITGVRIIGKIVKKNKSEQINSIIPIILKIKKEDKIHDDRLLIFTLAICARFDLKQCKKMVTDAYAAIPLICSDGLKLLMFAKFCRNARNILYSEGYLPDKSSSFGFGFRKAISNWYFTNDSLKTTEMIVRHQSYDGWTHRNVMNLIHIHSEDPTQKIFIMYTMCGMEMVEKTFGSTLKNVQIDSNNESYENKQLIFIYNFLKQVHNLRKMDDKKLQNEIELNRWGHMLEVIPPERLNNVNILTSLVKHMPLKTLLEKTFYLAKQRLFYNSSPDVGLWEYILRFNNLVQLEKSRIHPIESYIEYVKYSRTSRNILTIQNSALKKRNVFGINNLPGNKIKVFIETTKKENTKNDDITQSTVLIGKTEVIEKQNLGQTTTEKIKSNNIVLMTPTPKLVKQLMTFLSEDLINKTLKNLQPSDLHIIIAYDSRMCMKTKQCACTYLLNVDEAITLLTMSLIYPNKLPNKPTIRGLKEPDKQCNEIIIDYTQPLTFTYLQSILFEEPSDLDSEQKDNILDIDPLSTVDWAIENNKKYDVFVFLGTNKMNLKNAITPIKKYQAFLKKPIKIITCCLNGKHTEQINLGRGNMLFVVGFDKNIGKIINSFLNAEF